MSVHQLSLIISICIFHCTIFHAQTMVSKGKDLQNMVNSASPGDVFVVPNDTYTNFKATFEKIATADNPITIRAQNIGGVTLKGDSRFVFKKSAHIVLEGFIFDCEGENSLVKLEGSNHIRITRNVFELKTTQPIKWVFIGGIFDDEKFEFTSHHNRVDHNIFKNKMTPGHYITVDGTSNADRSDSRQSQYDRIDHNYFRNNGPRVKNEQESIRIGWSQMSMSSGFTTVEHNVFEDCDGDPEIISVKSSDNIIRHNTFRRSYGTLSLRHGNRSRVEGNYFFGGGKPNGTFETSTIHTGGIRVYGTDHVIVNNYMEGLMGTRWDAPIALTQGNAINGQSSDLTKHFRAERVTIAYNTLVNNTYGIEIGFDRKGNFTKKLKDITIANNIVTGSENNLVRYIDGNDQGEGVKWMNNIMFPTGNASLQSGGNAFTAEEVTNTNPNLSYDGTTWRATETSPVVTNNIEGLDIGLDIDGQVRPEQSAAGADYFSNEMVRYAPLTAEDVGPNAYEEGEGPTPSIFISSLETFESTNGEQEITVSANIDWIVSVDQEWITVSEEGGSSNGSLKVAVSENPSLEDRNGIVTISGGEITRTVAVIQKGANAPEGSEKLDIMDVSASSEQSPNTKDKTFDNDLNTRWSAQGVGEFITLDLGQLYPINLVKVAAHKGDSRQTFFEIAVSTDGVEYQKVTVNNNPNSQITTSGTTNELENYLLTSPQRRNDTVVPARYVRIIGGGNADSDWNSITEIQVYGSNAVLSVPRNDVLKLKASIYPIPASQNLTFTNVDGKFDSAVMYSIDGRKVLERDFTFKDQIVNLDTSILTSGLYILQISGDTGIFSEEIIISN